VARGKAVLDRDRHLQVRLIAEEIGLPKKDVDRIITEDLHMRKIWEKLVPKNLSDVCEFLAQRFPTYRTTLTWLSVILFIPQAQNPNQRISFWDS